MGKLHFSGGEIVVSDGSLIGDLVVEDGTIVDVKAGAIEIADAEKIDCSGKIVMPGVIDTSCGFVEKKAAIAGGVTTQLTDVGLLKVFEDASEDEIRVGLESAETVHFSRLSRLAQMKLLADKKDVVTTGVALHSLLLNIDDKDHLPDYVGSKPLFQERSDLFELWKGIKFEEVDVVASGHEKYFPAVEWLLPVMLNAVNDEALDIAEVVQLCCERPAKIFSLERKGKIEPGYDADLVVVDIDMERKVEKASVISECGWSPYEGLNFKGWPEKVFVSGELLFDQGKFVGNI